MEPCFYHQSHPQLGVVFALLHPFILSGVISPLISSSILGTYQPGEFLFQYPIILPFHTVHGVLKDAGLEETQAGIKIAGRNINNLRYTDDTTLIAESEEELKSLLMKVREE